MSAYAHPVANVYANLCADVHNTYLKHTPVHAWCTQLTWCTQHLSKCMHTLSKKMHMHSCMYAYATVQKLLCHGTYCEIILRLGQESYRLSFAARPPAVSTKSVAWLCSLKKSVQIHASSWRGRCCGVAAGIAWAEVSALAEHHNNVSVSVSVRVSVWEKVCVWERETVWLHVHVHVGVRVHVCVRVRECVCASVWVTLSVCVYFCAWWWLLLSSLLKNNLVIAIGTLSCFLTCLHIVSGVVYVVCSFADD